MAQLDNLNDPVLAKDILRRLKVLETAAPVNNTAFPDLPTTTNPPNVFIDPTDGTMYRCI